MNNMFSNFTNGRGGRRRKRNKSYYIGLLMLFIICVIYLILYPELGNLPGAEDTSYEGGTIVSPEEFYGEGTGSGVVSPEEFYGEGYGSSEASTEETVDTAGDFDSTEAQIVSYEQIDNEYTFKYPDRLTSHYEKHGISMGFSSEEEYLAGANALIKNPSALHKTEAEDGDDIYYLEATDEIVFVSKDGFIRTYFICDGKDYFDRQ